MSITETIKSAINNTHGNFGIYIKDITNSTVLMDINSEQPFPNASVAKIFVAGYILYLLNKKELTLETEFIHTAEDTLQGAGSLKNEPPGNKYKLLQLLKLMLIDSDNTASKILINNIGVNNINDYVKTYEYIKVSNLKIENNKFVGWGITTPKEAGMFLQQMLSENSVIKDIMKKEDSSQYMGYYLQNIYEKNKLNIYAKGGTLYPNVKNDVSIVEEVETHQMFLISYFSKDLNNVESSREIIRLISKEISLLINKPSQI